jgi:hypothetical protein
MSMTCSVRWLEVSSIFAAITSVISTPASCRSARTMHTADCGGTWPMLLALSGTVTTSSVGGCNADQGKSADPATSSADSTAAERPPTQASYRQLGRPLLPLRYLRGWTRMRSWYPELVQQPAKARIAHAVLKRRHPPRPFRRTAIPRRCMQQAGRVDLLLREAGRMRPVVLHGPLRKVLRHRPPRHLVHMLGQRLDRCHMQSYFLMHGRT